MAKYGNTHYLQLSRKIFTDEYKDLSNGAKWLFVVLNELEQRYTSGKANSNQDWFFRSDQELAADAGYSLATLKRYKKELKDYDIVDIGYMRYTDPKTGKKSEKRITAYKIMV